MTDPAQQIAARVALREAARYLALDAHDLTVKRVKRRRKQNTKQYFYDVTLKSPNGTTMSYEISGDGQLIKAVGLHGRHTPVTNQ